MDFRARMAKVHPRAPSSAICLNSEYVSTRRETFTLWMKSLVLHGNGCTVYNNSTGKLVYRIDNYGKKPSNNEVYLMDLHGNVLFTVQKKGFMSWKGYKQVSNDQKTPFLRVKKSFRKSSKYCEIQLGPDEESSKVSAACCYKIVGSMATKSAFKIINSDERVVAEVSRKQSNTGVLLGSDVLNLVVEPQFDHSVIMALVTVYGLVNHQL